MMTGGIFEPREDIELFPPNIGHEEAARILQARMDEHLRHIAEPRAVVDFNLAVPGEWANQPIPWGRIEEVAHQPRLFDIEMVERAIARILQAQEPVVKWAPVPEWVVNLKEGK